MRMKTGSWPLGVALVLAMAGASFAIRPDLRDSELLPSPKTQKLESHRKRSLDVTDLLDSGETLAKGRVSLKSDWEKQIVRRLNQRLKKESGDARVLQTQTDALGNRHIRLQQFYSGIPVVGSDLVVHVNPLNEVYAVGGSITESLNLPTIAKLKPDEASRFSQSAAPSPANARVKREPKLVAFNNTLAYEVIVEETGEHPAIWKTYIDAQTSEVIYRESQIIHAAPSGGTEAVVTGNRLVGEDGSLASIQGWKDTTGYFLHNSIKRWGVFDQDRMDWSQNPNGHWQTTDRAAISLARNMELTQNYVSLVLQRASFDGLSGFASANVHVGDQYANAFWDGAAFHFGDGDNVLSGPMTTLDVTAHEYGHAITQYTSNLAYSNESGALNESYSDILGALVEFWAQPDGRDSYPQGKDGQSDWMVGEDCWLSGEAIRDFRNPKRFSQPSYYKGTNWYSGAGDNGGIHTNSGVQNFAFYLLSEGGQGNNDGHPYSIAGMGIQQAGQIALYANQYLLTSNAQYSDAREAWILAAQTLGYDAQMVREVWTACGVLEKVSHLAITPNQLQFGSVGVGSTHTLNITLENKGSLAIKVIGITISHSVFSIDQAMPLILEGGAMLSLPVKFAPTAESSFAGTALIQSDAMVEPTWTLSLTGSGTAPAGLSWSPSQVSHVMSTGLQDTTWLTVTNIGTADLQFKARAVQDSAASQTQSGGRDVLLLYSTASFSDFHVALKSLPGIDSVGLRSGQHSTPSLLELKGYDAVIVMSDTYWHSPVLLGDVLADYVDQGGSVVLMGATHFSGGDWALGGRIMSPEYAPMATTAYSGSSVSLESFASHPINEGLTSLTSSLYSKATSPQGLGFSLGKYTGGSLIGAYHPNKPIVSLNAFPFTPFYGGDLLKQVGNAIGFVTQDRWLSIPEAGSLTRVTGGKSVSLPIVFQAAGLAGGKYSGFIELSHNVPGIENPALVPVSLDVQGIKKLSLSTLTLDFGNQAVGSSTTRSLTLSNPGTEATTISQAVLTGDSSFTLIDSFPVLIPAGSSKTISLSFSPLQNQTQTGTLAFLSNAQGNQEFVVTLLGTGNPAPELSLSPTSIQRTLAPGDTALIGVDIGNLGIADLNYTWTGAQTPWLVSPSDSGILSAGQKRSISVSIQATGLGSGIHRDTLKLTSNDPSQIHPVRILPVELTVTSRALLQASPTALDFGKSWIGIPTTQTLLVTNPGNTATTIESIQFNGLGFSSATPFPVLVPPFECRPIEITYSATTEGSVSASALLASNAFGQPLLSIPMVGNAKQPPKAVLSATRFDFALSPADAPADRTAYLKNEGGDVLKYQFSVLQQAGQSNPAMAPTAYAPATPRFAQIYALANYAAPAKPGEVIVALKSGRQNFSSPSLLAGLEVAKVEELAIAKKPVTGLRSHGGRKLLLVEFASGDKISVANLVDQLKQDPNVEYAEPNYIRSLSQTPNDPSFTHLYGLHNSGQTGGLADSDIDAPEAWASHTGDRSIVLGSLDTGIDYLHPDLADNIWINAAEAAGVIGVDDDGNGYVDDIQGYDFINQDSDPMDDNGHGTHTAGTMAAVGNNAIGVAGVAWSANVAVLKVFTNHGTTTDAAILNALDYANAMGMKITNNSWGGGPYSQSLYDMIAEGGALGHLFVAAAGNQGANADTNPTYPAAFDLPNILSVAATDAFDALADFSNFGQTSVDLGAPGVGIFSCQPVGGYAAMSGTSMAAPHVAGAAYLIWSANPLLSGNQVKDLILRHADPIRSLNGKTVSGGRLNVAKALAHAGTSWLSVTPTAAGILAPGDSIPVTVTVRAGGLAAGKWNGWVGVLTDDPADSQLNISVSADISGCRSLSLVPDAYHFGTVAPGVVVRTRIELRNACNDSVTVLSAVPGHPSLKVQSPVPARIPPFSSQFLDVAFTPGDTGSFASQIQISIDADTQPQQSIALSATAVTPYLAAVNPTSIARTLRPNQTTQVVMTISNPGTDVLNWTIDDVWQGLTSAAPYDATHFMDLPKGAADTRTGRDVIQARGSRDAFGYRWVDSDDIGGPTFQWNDIQSTGTLLPTVSDCDDCFESVGLSFSFPFYGNNYNNLFVGSNGYITFLYGAQGFANYPLPSASMPVNVVTAFYEDLNTTTSGDIYFQDFGTHAVVQFQNVGFITGVGSVTFQIVIKPNGHIFFYYHTMTGDLLTSTTGIQNVTRTIGLNIQYNTNYLKNGLAVQISTIPGWLRASELSGSIPAGGSHPVTLTLNSNGLVPGVYSDNILLKDNAPGQQPILIPVSLTVENPDFNTSKVWEIGPSAGTLAAGTRYRMTRLQIGSPTAGSCRGTRYQINLK